MSFNKCLMIAIWVVYAGGCGPKRISVGPSPEEIEWDKYHDAQMVGNLEEAKRGFTSLCERDYPRGCFNLGKVLATAEDVEGSQEVFIDFIKRFPEHALASSAIKRLARSYDDALEGVKVLESLNPPKSSEIYDSVLYRMAKLYQRAENKEEEKKILTQLVENTGRWNSQLWDDSMWQLIEISHEQGAIDEEQHLLKRFLATREKARLIGSHDSPYHDDALLRLGTVYMLKGDKDTAFKLFLELSKVKTSRLRDEALVEAAKLKIEQGKTKEACSLLGKALAIQDATCHDEAQKIYLMISCSK